MREIEPQTSAAPRPGTHSGHALKTWVSPTVESLPPLTDLTLATGGGIPGSGDPGSGSTVF
ncbi:MAG TPA: hypothetical protein VFH27_12620 [Longimicrobiaceae bacterium]|nr:hypothetical protein [Longimicrobiaceae bacterium]